MEQSKKGQRKLGGSGVFGEDRGEPLAVDEEAKRATTKEEEMVDKREFMRGVDLRLRRDREGRGVIVRCEKGS